MKTKKHYYSINPDITHFNHEYDDGSFRDDYKIVILKNDRPYDFLYGDKLDLMKAQAELRVSALNDSIDNLTLWGKIRYIFTGKI